MRWAFLGAALLLAGAAAAAEPPRLSIASEAVVETVFRWATERCEVLHLPDSPARALRTADGGVLLMAAHLVNIPLLGPDFDRLRPACAASSRGEERPDPAALADRFWVQALVPFGREGRREVLGLASHEFMGGRHPGLCATSADGSGRVPAAFRCWVSAIIPVVAEAGEWHFRPLTPGAAIVASPFPYDGRATARTGFFSVSNALVANGAATVLVYTEGVPGQPRGNCLLRARLDALPGGWRVLARGEFVEPGSAPCDVVGAEAFGAAAIRSVLRVGEWYAAVFTRAARRGQATEASDGVFVSFSRDLRQWSPPGRLWAMTPFRSQPEAGTYYEYPSLIDHAGPGEVFDAAAAPGAARIHLYLTRLNLEDRRRGLDRDLVRIAVTLEDSGR
jgi:hypothetical protein